MKEYKYKTFFLNQQMKIGRYVFELLTISYSQIIIGIK